MNEQRGDWECEEEEVCERERGVAFLHRYAAQKQVATHGIEDMSATGQFRRTFNAADMRVQDGSVLARKCIVGAMELDGESHFVEGGAPYAHAFGVVCDGFVRVCTHHENPRMGRGGHEPGQIRLQVQ